MNRTTLLALAAAAAFAFPASAALAEGTGDPALDAFQSLCRATGNDYNAVGKAAAAAGWGTAQLEPDAQDGISITGKAAWEKTFGAQTVTLLESTGLRHTKAGDIPMTSCKISTNKPDAGVVDRAKAWLGFAPDGGDATLAVFYVKSGTGQPEHIPPSGLQDAMNSGGFSIVKVQQDAASAILDYQSYSK